MKTKLGLWVEGKFQSQYKCDSISTVQHVYNLEK